MSRHHRSAAEGSNEKFSLPLFLATITATLGCLLAIVRFGFPGIWSLQLHASPARAAAAFFSVSLLNCFIEYFFHRYLLHTPALPLLGRFYRQHTRHHALTRVVRRRTGGGRSLATIENVFPIVEAEQGEASFFPWYTLAGFAAVISPLLAVMQRLLPSYPWFFSGFAALATSLTLYELLHAANHWPLGRWEPLIASRRWGWFWRPAYAFHLRHHAVPDCNESISGFFGLPLADWVFRTCLIPETIYADGEDWAPEKFRSPRPAPPIRLLDRWVEKAVRRRRAAAAAPDRTYSSGERISAGLTRGLGLALSVASLTLLVLFSCLRGDARYVTGFSVFGFSLLALHTVQTLYHAWRSDRSRWLLGRLGQMAGFVLVAGTYTPILLTKLHGSRGWTLFGVAWGLCGAGAASHLLWGERFRHGRALRWITAAGILAVLLKPMLASVPPGGLWLMAAGGLCYTGSGPFARWRELKYHHTFRHALLVAGGACHVLAALLFLLPAGS